MTKNELNKHINLYKETEETVLKLEKEYGINIYNSKKSNFYNNYNLLIHNLLVSIFGDLKTDMIEEYCFNQYDNMTFDELCEKLGNLD